MPKTALKRFYPQLILSLCLALGQVAIHLPVAHAQTAPAAPLADNVTSIVINNPTELANILNLTRRIRQNAVLLKFLNEVFADQLQIPEDKQALFAWPTKTKALSESQLMFLLNHLPTYWGTLNEYLLKVNATNENDPEILKFREELKAKFRGVLMSEEIQTKFKNMNDPTQKLLIVSSDGKPTFSGMEAYVNYPGFSEPTNKRSRLIPADNLKQVVLNFIRGAKYSITGNVFEFNLADVAQTLIAKSNKGVKVTFGIDKTTTENAPENKAVRDMLLAQQQQVNDLEKFRITLVDSVGLNHQKLLVRDAGTPSAAVLELSGNLTQSCIGPEGDLVAIPEEDRPEESRPNKNNAIFLKGVYPAMVVEDELKKTLVEGLRGISQYPISGSYVFQGPLDVVTKTPTEIGFTFSPNGGYGNVSSSVIVPEIMRSQGEVLAMLFAASSPEVEKALTDLAIETIKKGDDFKFLYVGDPAFSMRDWSLAIHMSGLQVNPETKKYEPNPAFVLAPYLKAAQVRELQRNIRINPKMFGDFYKNVTVNGVTQKLKISIKLHDKTWIFPKTNRAIVGSFNPSKNAESNQEQIVTVQDSRVVNRLLGSHTYLFNSSPTSVAARAKFRNIFSVPEEAADDKEADFIDKNSKKAKETKDGGEKAAPPVLPAPPATETTKPLCAKVLAS